MPYHTYPIGIWGGGGGEEKGRSKAVGWMRPINPLLGCFVLRVYECSYYGYEYSYGHQFGIESDQGPGSPLISTRKGRSTLAESESCFIDRRGGRRMIMEMQHRETDHSPKAWMTSVIIVYATSIPSARRRRDRALDHRSIALPSVTPSPPWGKHLLSIPCLGTDPVPLRPHNGPPSADWLVSMVDGSFHPDPPPNRSGFVYYYRSTVVGHMATRSSVHNVALTTLDQGSVLLQ